MINAALMLLILATTETSARGAIPSFPGDLSLPPHHTIRRTGTIDSEMGEITGPDGFVMSYDIGYMAGTHMYEGRRKECVWLLEHTVANQKALTGVFRVGATRRVVTTIWEQTSSSPPANFWATLRTEKDLATFLAIVMTYKPAKRQ